MAHSILVVEDSPTQADALRHVLEDSGFEITVARSGEAAQEQLAARKFDMVVTDVVMPGISGYELCQFIKADPVLRDTPVMVLTTLGDPMDIVRGLESGADNYITKPYDVNQLLMRIRRVLDNRRLRPHMRTTMGVNIEFLGTTFTITSDREQILDLLLSSVEDIVRANQALEERQNELADAHRQLKAYAREKTVEAHVSTERYRALMRNAGDAIFLLDAEDRIIEANLQAEELLGQPAEELLWQPLISLFTPEEARPFAAWLDSLRFGEPAHSPDRVILRPDGSIRSASFSGSVTRIDDQEFTLCIARDVTMERDSTQRIEQSERRLAESEAVLRTLVDAAPGAIVQLTADARVLIWNPAAERIFGWTAAEVVGRPLPFLTEGEGERPDNWERSRLEMMSFEDSRARRDGTPVDLSVSTAPMPGSDGAPGGVIAVVTDITDRKRAEEQLRRSQDELRQAQRMEAIGRLAGGIAHDFNNMLTAIKGSAQLLLLDLPQDTPQYEEVSEIDKAASRAAALTRQLLAFSRSQVLQPEVIELNRVVSQLEGMLRRLISERIEFELQLDPDLGHVLADPGQLEQVILNLVVNASDAMPDGGRLRIETMRLQSPAAGETELPVVIRVCDTGTGMSPEVRERIFEPFFTSKEQGKGTGLGMSTVYGIVAQTGGRIEVESEPGRGTAVTIMLPAAVPDDASVTAGSESPAPPASVRGSGPATILLVEDEDSVRRLAVRILRRSGYTVLEAASGAEAEVLFDAHADEIDLLITDLVMPEIGGREVANRLRLRRPDLRVLLMSGYSGEDMGVWAGAADDFPLLEKPFTLEGFASTVRDLLAD